MKWKTQLSSFILAPSSFEKCRTARSPKFRACEKGIFVKSSPVVEIEELREEVARLGAAVAELEARFEAEEIEDDPWNIWPYSWVTAGHQKACQWFQSFQENQGRRALERHNRRTQHGFDAQNGGRELKLI